MSTETFYCYCPCFPGFGPDSPLALNSWDWKTSYLTHLCETWALPYDVILEYFSKYNDLTYDWYEYGKEAFPMYCEIVGDEIYHGSLCGLDMELSFVREERITTLGPRRRKYEEHKLLMRAIFDPEELVAYLRRDPDGFAEYLALKKVKSSPEKWCDPANWDEPRILEIILEYVLRNSYPNPDERIYNRQVYEVDPEEYIGTPEDFTNYIQDDEGNACYQLNAEYERLMRQGPAYLEAMKKARPRGWEKYIPEVERGKARVIRELAEDLDIGIRKYTAEKSA